MTPFNSKAMLTTDNNSSYHIKDRALVYQSYGFHIMPLVINSLGVDTHVCTHTDVHTETISRNQARSSLYSQCMPG